MSGVVIHIGRDIREVLCTAPSLICATNEEQAYLRNFDKPIHDCEAFRVV